MSTVASAGGGGKQSGAEAARYLPDEQVSARLRELEARRNLLTYRWGNWSIWPLLRYPAAQAFQQLPLDYRGTRFSRAAYLGMALKDLPRLLRVRAARYVVKTFSSSHREHEAGRKKDVYFDDLVRALGGCYKIEFPNDRRFHRAGEKYVIPPDLSTVALDGLAIQLARRFQPQGLRELASSLSAALCAEPGLEAFSPSYVARLIAEFHWSRRMYRMLFARIRPACLLLADTADFAVTAAARELGVQVVELQHGFVHRHSLASSWSGAAVPFKPGMPLPHRLLVYGPYWARELAAHGFWSDELRAVGSPQVDRHRAAGGARDATTCTIVVTTQGVDTARLIGFLRDALSHVGDKLDYRMMLKTHPTYDRSDSLYQSAFADNPRVRLVRGSEAPGTYELLRTAHLHLSIASTCHYEALALGVPTIIAPFSGSESVEHLHRSGHAFLPRSAPELAGVLCRWREHRVPAEVGHEYFTPGALENIQRELAALPV